MQLSFKVAPLVLLAITITTANIKAQKVLVHAIKGQVMDDISKSPIEGATVSLLSDSSIITSTDKSGLFSLSAPVGRQSIVISSLGYEEQVINEVLVTSGKEVMVNIFLTEKITRLIEVVVKGSSKRALNNEMVVVSGRTFNADDARKYAGSLGDPSRMVAGFAGVSSSNDSRNDIIVRGNSPNGLLW